MKFTPADCLQVNYTRWLCYCHVPAFCDSLPHYDTTLIFGRTLLKSVFQVEVIWNLSTRHFSTVNVQKSDLSENRTLNSSDLGHFFTQPRQKSSNLRNSGASLEHLYNFNIKWSRLVKVSEIRRILKPNGINVSEIPTSSAFRYLLYNSFLLDWSRPGVNIVKRNFLS